MQAGGAQDETIRFDRRVAIVTGGGGGMGACYARELARRGAAVVVNDYGGDMFGRGADPGPANAVAEAIRAEGGKAIANTMAVGTADAARAIIAVTIEAFGQIDILINNAGVSASGALTAPSDAHAENAFRTNLLGPYHLMRAVWNEMARRSYGRILNISSNAALGMGGSAAYAATKSGLLGLTFDTAKEGAASGILVNALMPTAYSRMIEAVPDKLFVDWMREQLPPDKVAALALYLVSGASSTTGCVFSTGGGRAARVAWFETPGIVDAALTPERAQACLDRIVDLGDAFPVDSQQVEIGLYMQALPMLDGRKVEPLPPSLLATKKPRS